MRDFDHLLPDRKDLEVGLTAVLRANGAANGKVIVLGREPNPYITNHYSEIVTCSLPDGARQKVINKYGLNRGRKDEPTLNAIEYEREVYRQVLVPAQVSAPKLYGTFEDRCTGTISLILEYLDQDMVLRLAETEQPDAFYLAARWLGQFHAASEALLSASAMPFLTTYGLNHYLKATDPATLPDDF